LCRFSNPGENLEQRAFPSAVSTNNSDDFTSPDVKRNISQGPKGFSTLMGRSETAKKVKRPGQGGGDVITQGLVPRLDSANMIQLAQIFYFDDVIAHPYTTSAKILSIFLK
jgi:hypothetical protein